MIGKKVIIRADRAGVFYGVLKEKNGSEVTLTDCRRLWCWYGAASISQLAVEGTKRPNDCKFTLVVPIISILGLLQEVSIILELLHIKIILIYVRLNSVNSMLKVMKEWMMPRLQKL